MINSKDFFKAKIIEDSIAPCGIRLITLEATYPRFIHSELMTHRVFSRNAASSRAIPIENVINKVVDNPAAPIYWGMNKSGMSPVKEISDIELAQELWLEARDKAVAMAKEFIKLKVHKQIVNRILEPYSWMTTIITSTQWSNWDALRMHPDAQQEIAYIAELMKEARDKSTPIEREWHLPYVDEHEKLEYPIDVLCKVSTARCARVSHLTHDGKRDISKDIGLHDRLLTGSGTGHWSPFEHVARALYTPLQCGNFVGWEQYRKMHKGECL